MKKLIIYVQKHLHQIHRRVKVAVFMEEILYLYIIQRYVIIDHKLF